MQTITLPLYASFCFALKYRDNCRNYYSDDEKYSYDQKMVKSVIRRIRRKSDKVHKVLRQNKVLAKINFYELATDNLINKLSWE